MDTALQAAHDALIQTPEFAAFLNAGGHPGNLPYTPTMLHTALLVRKMKPAPMRNEDAYHEMPDDRELTNYK